MSISGEMCLISSIKPAALSAFGPSVVPLVPAPVKYDLKLWLIRKWKRKNFKIKKILGSNPKI